ncbi:hypothetical protein MRB56_09270 [Halomonas cupida]|uniref:hypothetical protein n=1 Tax=Halomonas cupida TaxID=44933 RepID=UPI0039B55332
MAQGATYQAIADELGMTPGQVYAYARRQGFTDPARQGAWKRRDWAEVDEKIRECVEARCMSLNQVVDYLNALGICTSYSSVRKRVLQMPKEVQKQARENGQRRISSNAYRMRLRIKRAA